MSVAATGLVPVPADHTPGAGTTHLLTTDMIRTGAEAVGVCVRPVLRRVTDTLTGQSTTVPIPCGSTRATRCPTCADKARRLRIHQCREGWHLTDDPAPALDDHDQDQDLDPDSDDGEDVDEADGDNSDVAEGAARRVRSTRRRSDVPDLPRVAMTDTTLGRTYTDPATGREFRPSMFLTLTLPSYGPVVPGVGVPRRPGSYDYRRAALDAMHFPKLVDRFWQNLRRVAGYRVQYFAAVEGQRRLAPHLHAAVRGSIPRATIRAVTAATTASIWWPSVDTVMYDDDAIDAGHGPTWDPGTSCYVDPTTGVALRSWDEALDDLDTDPHAAPMHVLRFGDQVDVKGLLGGTDDSDRAVRYLCKYLTKAVATTYTDDGTEDPNSWAATEREAHTDRLHAWTRVLPCSPRCANWLRYGITPKDPGPGLTPGRCPAPAHDRENAGVGGRRALVSRHWTGKTLTEHRADRATVVREVLTAAGYEPEDADRLAADTLHDGLPRYVWTDTEPAERDYQAVITTSIRQARLWREQYDQAKAVALQRGSPPPAPVDNRSATAPAREEPS
ncbi:MAG: replication initiator [Phycicoccus sp.]